MVNSDAKGRFSAFSNVVFLFVPRTVKEYNDKVEYIRLNPVKAGLVQWPEDWPWSSMREYSRSMQEESLAPLPSHSQRVAAGRRTCPNLKTKNYDKN